MTRGEFIHSCPVHMEHIAEQSSPTLTEPHCLPQPDLELHSITFRILAGAGGAAVQTCDRPSPFLSNPKFLSVLLLAMFEFESRLDSCAVELL